MKYGNINNLLDKASVLCLKSTMNQRHAALLLNKKNIIIGSYNAYPRHAEHVIIDKIKSKGLTSRKLTILVVRLMKNGMYSNSRPCNHCIMRMKSAGIARVIYTTGDNQLYMIERTNEMAYKHISSGYAHRKSLNNKSCLF